MRRSLGSETGADHPPIAERMPDVLTERLDLRRFDVDDLDALAAVFAQPEVWQFPYGRAFTREETAAFLRVQMNEWAQCGFGCWIAWSVACRSPRTNGAAGSKASST